MRSRLNNDYYMGFPLVIGEEGAVRSTRSQHIREQIEQVLFTNPGERWYRNEFGIGVRALVFEPNNKPLWELTRKRLLATLAESLKGEVLPETLDVQILGEDATLKILISYQLAALRHTERLELMVKGDELIG